MHGAEPCGGVRAKSQECIGFSGIEIGRKGQNVKKEKNPLTKGYESSIIAKLSKSGRE